MPQNKAIWTSFVVPDNGTAFDARHWNSLVAPNRNLDVINLNGQSTAYLNLTVTSFSVPNNIATRIIWDTAVYPDPSMWTPGSTYGDFIYLVPKDNPYIGLWNVDVNISFATASAGTRKYVRVTFVTGTFNDVIKDDYEDHTANNPHQFNISLLASGKDYLSGEITTNPSYFYVDVLQNSGAAINMSGSLFVQQIPSAAKNYFPDNYS
jgi:hypothetical protein